MDQDTSIIPSTSPAPSSDEAGEVDLVALVGGLSEADITRMVAAQRGLPSTIPACWLSIGYGTVPLDRHTKAPVERFVWIGETMREDAITILRGWIGDDLYSQSPRAGLCLDGLEGSLALSVMDLDDMSLEKIARSRLPRTPLEVATGRDGGGRHLYYRRDPAGRTRGSRAIRAIGADFKGHHGYVVCPGSTHRSGMVYKAYWNGVEVSPDQITYDMIAALPALPDDLVQTLVDESRAMSLPRSTSPAGFVDMDMDGPGLTSRGVARGQTPSGMDRVIGASTTAVITYGRHKGLTVAEVAALVGPGRHSVCCPHEDHTTDERGGTAASLTVSDGGEAQRTVCFACSRSYTYGVLGSHTAHAAPPATTSAPGTLNLMRGSHGYDEVTIDQTWLSDAGHFGPEQLTRVVSALGDQIDQRRIRVMVLALGQGQGKTQIAGVFAKNTTRAGGRVIGTSPIRSLSRSLASRLGVPCYLDLDPQASIEGSASVCTPSLRKCPSYRIMPDSWEIDPAGASLLVHDECEQQVAALGGDHLDDKQAHEGWAALVRHTMSATLTLMLDADAGPLTAHLLRAAKIDPSEVLWIRGPHAASRDAVLYRSRAEHTARMIESAKAGKRLAIMVHSEKEARTLSRLIPRHAGGKTLIVSGKSRVDLGRLDEAIREAGGHVIATPVIMTGVSIDLREYVDEVHGILCDSIGTGQTGLQLMSRVRHPMDRTLYLSRLSGGRTPAPWERDPEQVEKVWRAREAHTMKRVGWSREIPMPETGGYSSDQTAYVRVIALAHSTQVRGGLGRATYALLDLIQLGGGHVTEVVPADRGTPEAQAAQAVRASRRIVREEVETEDVQAVVSAQDLPDERLIEIRRTGPQTDDDAAGLRRAAIDRTYGDGAADQEEVVRWDDDGRGRSRVRAYAGVVAAIEGGMMMKSIRRLDDADLTHGVSAARLRHRTLQAQGRAALLRRLIGQEGLIQMSSIENTSLLTSGSAPISLPSEGVQAVLTLLRTEAGAALATLIGLSTADIVTHPMRVIGRLLTSCGLTMTARRARVDGEVTRVYSVDMDDLSILQTRASALIGRLRAGLAISDEITDVGVQDAGVSAWLEAMERDEQSRELLSGVMDDLKAA